MTWAFVVVVAIIAVWVIVMRYLDTRATSEVRIGSPMGRSKSWKGVDIPEDVIDAWKEAQV